MPYVICTSVMGFKVYVRNYKPFKATGYYTATSYTTKVKFAKKFVTTQLVNEVASKIGIGKWIEEIK